MNTSGKGETTLVTSVETYCLPFVTFFACSEILLTLEECSAQYVIYLTTKKMSIKVRKKSNSTHVNLYEPLSNARLLCLK